MSPFIDGSTEMKGQTNHPHSALAPALEAISNLWLQERNSFFSNTWMVGLSVHLQIEVVPPAQKSVAFYQHFLPLRQNLVAVLADSYRRYFRVGLANPHIAGPNPHDWAWLQLQSAIYAAANWISDWYTLACSGENRFIPPIGSMDVASGTVASLTVPLAAPHLPAAHAWRAPAWLFSVLPDLTGIGLMKPNHVPATDSEIELSAAHSRLILKGARRVFLWELAGVIETIRDEETAAAAAVPVRLHEESQGTKQKKRARFRGLEGLGQKESDLSRYTHGLTDKQHLAFSLKYEYRLGLAEIADRMGINRKTAHEHLAAANKRLKRVLSSEQYKSHQAKNVRE
jgi:hypothetical protein